MKLRLVHPLWTHLPALLLFAVALVLAMSGMPQRVPTHFAFDGHADGWGSPSILRHVFVMIPLSCILISLVIDELFCRFENAKKFNLLALFDEGMVGFSLGLEIAVLGAIHSSDHVLRGDLKFGLSLAVCAMAVAAVIEYFRPASGCAKSSVELPKEASEMPVELLAKGQWFHWEIQNPLYMNVLMCLLLVIPVFVFFMKAPLLIFLLLLGVMLPVFLIFYGGMRVSVTPSLLTVRFGLFNIPFLKIRFEEVATADFVTFNPIADLGGWGIRYSSTYGWCYLLSGSDGVRLTLKNGRKYMIGSDAAERLASICRAAVANVGKVRG